MSLKPQFELMADYNRWMNGNLYQVAAELPVEALHGNRGAYFDSIYGTLNHILVGDIIWLRRFSRHTMGLSSLAEVGTLPAIVSLKQILYHDFADLREAREDIDRIIVDFTREATEVHFDSPVSYKNTHGVRHEKRFGFLVQHFFNHQTHHRGQVTTLLSQLGLDPGVTDLLALIPGFENA